MEEKNKKDILIKALIDDFKNFKPNFKEADLRLLALKLSAFTIDELELLVMETKK